MLIGIPVLYVDKEKFWIIEYVPNYHPVKIRRNIQIGKTPGMFWGSENCIYLIVGMEVHSYSGTFACGMMKLHLISC